MRIVSGFAHRDRPAIAALYWEAFGSKLGRAMGPRDKALRFFVATLSPDHCFTAYGPEGEVIGVAGFKTREGALVAGGFPEMRAVYGRLGALWRLLLLAALERDTENARFLMDGIFVAEGARGRGVGSALLEAVAREAERRGYTEMRLDVIDENPRARALYERRGFRAVATHSIGLLRLVFRFRSATTMVRRLGPADRAAP